MDHQRTYDIRYDKKDKVTIRYGKLVKTYYTLQDIEDEIVTSPEWVITGVLPQKARVLVYGEWGALKSFFMVHKGLHIAAGKTWLGFPVPKQRVVAYHDEEMADEDNNPRIKALRRGADIPLNAPFYRFTHLGLRADATLVPMLRRHWEEAKINPDIVMIETVQELLGANQSEKEAGVARSVWKLLRPLFDEGKTIELTHHKRKPFREGSDSVRNQASGSQDWLAGADWAIALSLTDEDGISKASFEKTRRTRKTSPFLCYLEGDIKDKLLLKVKPFKQRGPGNAGKWMEANPDATVQEAIASGKISRSQYYELTK